MGRYLIRRILWMIPVLLFISIVTFALAHAVPGGPFDREKPLPAEILANLNRYYGLDQPLWKQYTDYMGLTRNPAGEFAGVLEGKFGPSYASRSRTVNDIFAAHLPVSAQLGLVSLLISIGIGVPLGVIAALKQNSFWDYFSMGLAILGVSVPNIVLGPVFILIFALTLHWFPVAGWGSPEQMIMPALALGLGQSAIIARLTRASMLQVIREDYIRTARAKGLSERAVIVQHALKNAFIPVATILGPMFAALLTGTFVVEQIFCCAWHGPLLYHQHHQPRLSGGHGNCVALCTLFSGCQLDGGHDLWFPGSTDLVRIGVTPYDLSRTRWQAAFREQAAPRRRQAKGYQSLG